jgi:hypothetical protein
MNTIKTALSCAVALLALVGWLAVVAITTAWHTLVLGRGAEEQIDAKNKKG